MPELIERLRELTGATLADVGATAFQLLTIVVVTWIALRVAHLVVDASVGALLDRETTEGTAQELSAIEVAKRKDTLRGLGYALLRAFIVIIGALMALRAVDLDIGPAIAGLGIAGVAIGLGAQHLVRDYLAGAFILIENQFARGDVVKVVDVTGTVEDFTLRRTTLRDFDGTVHTVPNGLIGVASNLTRVWARVTLDIVVDPTADLEAATRAIDAAAREMADDEAWRRRVLEVPRVDRLEAIGAQGVTLRVVGSVRAADRWAAAGELRRRIHAALAAASIPLQAG
jgi:moderate conductance mechanosensitive channel